MNKYGLAVIALGGLMISFGLGYMLACSEPVNKPGVPGQNQSVLGIDQKKDIVNEDTKIIFEQEFLRCNHLVISSFPNQDKLLGKDIDKLRQEFSEVKGYALTMDGNTLTIRHKIEDWCPAEKEKCRLKEYQGRLAVFQGPDPNSDTLLRVTEIKIEMLPPQIAEDIKQGNYEFENEAALNDALENLDEYIQ
ncbi:hypothetical protein ASZ90_018494 [hydrocarbon metagenome]|uniref:Bypass of forespore C C-terminal domain-containing protein n=1 Tax=hydrocarbon metagenome TaxID=938273 RepID=A0A0W8E656_9ZZZZ